MKEAQKAGGDKSEKYVNKDGPRSFEFKKQSLYIAARRLYHRFAPRRTPPVESSIIVLHEPRIILVTIPKVASRSILGMVAARWPGSEAREQSVGTLETALRTRPDYWVVAFVRNPWDRAYSCYSDKIARLDVRGAHARRIASHPGLRPGMAFADFVRWLATDAGSERAPDRHWAAQTRFLTVEGAFRCDHFFRIEELEADLPRIREVFGDPSLSFPRRNVSTRISEDASLRRRLYDDETSAIIRTRYAADIERFGYVF